MLNVTNVPFGRLKGLFRCCVAGSSNTYDLMLVQALRESKWRPPTAWDTCRILEPLGPFIVGTSYAIQGALLTDVDLENGSGQHFIVEDCIDADMFLRMGN
jgi:hypothetical protein